MSFLDIVSKFNQQADGHSKSQSLNPFSERFEQSRSPSPRFSREDYGKPVAGSKTDLRGRKAKTHICREILELCTVIHDVGTYNAKKRSPEDYDDDNEEDDGTIIVSFGELFQIYTKISDKVVGLLIAAKRRGFVYFDREILFQRRDDDVLIALLKPISEISKILKDDISQTNAPAPTAESKPAEKKKSTSSSKTKRVQPAECNNEQTQKIDNSTTTVDQTKNVILEVNGDVVVQQVENNGGNDYHGETIKLDEDVNGGGGAAAEETVIDNRENNDDDKTNHVEDVVVNGGETVVEIETHDGTNGGDDGEQVVETNGNNELNGEQVVEIQINGEMTAVDDEIKRDDEIKHNDEVSDTVVVEGEVVDDVGGVSESIEVESNIRDTCENDVIDETTKTIDLNESSGEVIEDKNENVHSSGDKDVEEKTEDVQDDKYVNGDKVNVTEESIEGVSSCNGVENINGPIEHIIPITREN